MDTGLKFAILGHSLLTAAAATFYLTEFFLPFTFVFSYSVVALIFLALSIVVNLSSFCFASSRKVKPFIYLFIVQVILCVAFAVAGGITINKETADKQLYNEFEKQTQKYGLQLGALKFGMRMHQSLKCCIANDAREDEGDLIFSKINQISKIGNPAPDDYRDYSNSCCAGKIASNDECTTHHERYYTSTCRDAFDRKVNVLKYGSIAIFVLSAIYQCFLSYGFYRSAKSEA